MWICLKDAFFSIVDKHCARHQLLVRARRHGDIERVFGVRATRTEDADYLYRAVLSRNSVEQAMVRELRAINYGNFKSAVDDDDLHNAYLRVWSAMMPLQEVGLYVKPRRIPEAGLFDHEPMPKQPKRTARKRRTRR